MNQEEHILELICSFLAGEISSGEQESLRQWLEDSEQNRRYFEEMKATWLAAGSVDDSATFNSEKAWQKVAGKKPVRTHFNHRKPSIAHVPAKNKRIIRRVLQAVAVVVVIFLGGMLTTWHALKPEIDRANEITTLAGSEYTVVVPRGSKSTIMLPDGTRVILNAASKITYATDYGFSSREISLEGEAYFDVETNPEKPFTIHTSDLDIRAFGTAFNVKAYPEDPMVTATLEHGELKINSRKDQLLDMTLKPKQNVVYYKAVKDAKDVKGLVKSEKATDGKGLQKTENRIDIPAVSVTDNVNTGLYTSWKDSEWQIESQTFGELAGSLERRYDIRIIFGSGELKNYRFSGTIRNETVEQVLNVLTITAPMKYSIDQGVVQLQIDPKRKSNYDALSR